VRLTDFKKGLFKCPVPRSALVPLGSLTRNKCMKLKSLKVRVRSNLANNFCFDSLT